ncbi:uncharacterized protein A4U43_C10F18320 [Asparagus officinalis]|uniref:Uncharacterized protein n=1 Tax=Asparagus officinalis TaxID=4686 RepID=A0A5P1E716_ASPOF|nr:uncharacterized protein A4U43_C10F18320 [Asparagus officinalis]
MPIRSVAIGSHREAYHPGALKAALAEFISTLIFVFAGQGSGMAFNRLKRVLLRASSLRTALIRTGHGSRRLHAFASSGRSPSAQHLLAVRHGQPRRDFGASSAATTSPLPGPLYGSPKLLGTPPPAFLSSALPPLGPPTGSSFDPPPRSPLERPRLEIVMTSRPCLHRLRHAARPKKVSRNYLLPIAMRLIVGSQLLAGGPLMGRL